MNIIVFALKEEDCIPDYNGWVKIYTGIGKVNATYAITKAITKYKPKKVINFGTAGGVNLNKNEFVKFYKLYQLDMYCDNFTPLTFATPFEEDIGFIGKDGIRLGTSDTFVTNSEDIRETVDLVDMEAYALAKVCKSENIEFKSYKYITDTCDEESHTDWNSNILKAKEFYKSVMETE